MRYRLLAVSLLALCFLAPLARATTYHCVFHKAHDSRQGTCGKLGDTTPVFTLSPADGIKSGVWRKDVRPQAVWDGGMTHVFTGYTKPLPIELEIFANGRGILRTLVGWFPVSGFTEKPALAFDLDADHEVPPSPLGAAIVRRAAQILSSKTAWNRADNRKCPADAKTWSIYCAMKKATIEVTGGFHHRRPALQVVRIIIQERRGNPPYEHRLMDYNNDKTTTLADVQSLFREALKDMNNPAWLAAHGFAPSVNTESIGSDSIDSGKRDSGIGD